jgi:hypothetical protein
MCGCMQATGRSKRAEVARGLSACVCMQATACSKRARLSAAASMSSAPSSSVHFMPRRDTYSAYAAAFPVGPSCTGPLSSSVLALAKLFRSAAISRLLSRPRASPKQPSASNALRSRSLPPAKGAPSASPSI